MPATPQTTNPAMERAEIEESIETGSPCTRCEDPIGNVYFTLGATAICERCRLGLEIDPKQGSRMLRLGRAGLFGGIAAAVAAGIWLTIAEVTGREFGIVAIAVGWGVGSAVHLGSRGQGGLGYQLIAVALTYLAIVSTYTPLVFLDLMASNEETAATLEQASDAEGLDTPGFVALELPATDEAPVEVAPAPAAENALAELGPVQVAMAALLIGAIVLGIAAALPFIGGMNAIGLLIIGVALYEAWILNRRPDRTISGPFESAKPLAATPR